MKKIVFGSLATLLLLVGVGVAWWFFGMKKPPAAPPVGAEFPQGGGGGSLVTVPVVTQQGGTMTARDFIHNGTTVEDPANPGSYYLAGETGYCDSQGVCAHGASSKEFSIVYYPEDSSFVVALLAEPLGQARKGAEQFLMNTTGLSSTELCALKYYVGTDSYRSAQFSGTNLGFSFCPGATKLP